MDFSPAKISQHYIAICELAERESFHVLLQQVPLSIVL